MLLVFDVGNTETTLGVFDGERLAAHWRIITATPRTTDELGVTIRALLEAGGIDWQGIDGVAIASVVPPVSAPLLEACTRYLPVTRSLVVDAATPLPIRLAVDEPRTVGADRIVNTLAASQRYGRDAIVVDLGTATTYDCITADGTFLGGVIAPGVRTSLDTLIRRTSKLPATEMTAPARTIGTRTEDCIRAGVMFGAAEAIDGIVRRIKAEWPNSSPPLVVATGGLAETFAALCREFDEIDPFLTLEGLRMAHGMADWSDSANNGISTG